VVSVASGADALRKLQDIRPDVIFMDYMMPEMDGLEACRAIVNNPATAAIPVIMTTSNDTPEFRKRGVASGARGFLSKGLEDRELDNVLDSVADSGVQPGVSKGATMENNRVELNEQTLAMIRDQATNAARRASEEYFTGQLPGLEEQVIRVAETAALNAVAGKAASGASSSTSNLDGELLRVLQKRIDNLPNDKQLRAAIARMIREESVASDTVDHTRQRAMRSGSASSAPSSGFGRWVRRLLILAVLLGAAYVIIVTAFPDTPLAIQLQAFVDSLLQRMAN
jgi:CheY-like chemotaxis protein